MSFYKKLNQAWQRYESLLCVGLDPEPTKFPLELGEHPDKIFQFCKSIVDATAEFSSSFKPQIAYFAANRAEEQLEELCQYIKTTYPEHVLILDAKRGDIGSTAEQYAREAFERYQADAVTVNPYMGFDSIEPYLSYKDKGVLILCRTSNAGGSDLQFVKTHTQEPLYLHVARLVAEKWNRSKQCGLVVGATFPNEIHQVRQIVGDSVPLLIPGIGAQGGDVQATVKAGKNSQQTGMMVNSSRAIIYASKKDDWRCAARLKAVETRDQIHAALQA